LHEFYGPCDWPGGWWHLPTRFMREYIHKLPQLQAQRTLQHIYAIRLANADPEDRNVIRAMDDLQDQAQGITVEDKRQMKQSLTRGQEALLLASIGGKVLNNG
jgi:hypothetical protein